MEWFNSDLESVSLIAMTVVGIYAAVIVFTRLNGLRTYSKMSSFDFAITVAVGSVIASTALSETPSLTEGVVALAALFGCQRFVSWARYHYGASEMVDNEPVLIMVGDTLFKDVLERTRVTEEDVYAKLREANVLDFDEVQAVILEATGDIAVLHGEPDTKRLNTALLKGVQGQARLESGGDAPDPKEAQTAQP